MPSWDRLVAKQLGATPESGQSWGAALHQKLAEVYGQEGRLLPEGGSQGQVVKLNSSGDPVWGTDLGGADGGADWGSIGGTLSEQTDLQNALDAIDTEVSQLTDYQDLTLIFTNALV
jgi:hypothetical protein